MTKFNIFIAVVLVLTSCTNLNKANIDLPVSSEQTIYFDAERALLLGDYNTAISLYETLVSHKANDVSLLLQYARALRMSNQTDKAISVYDQILTMDSVNLDAKEGKGLSFLQLGDSKQAEQVFNEVLNRDALRWRTVNALGVLHALDGDIAKAKIYYEMAIAIDSKNPVVLNNIGLSMALSGYRQDAILVIQDAIKLLPESDIRREKMEMNLALAYGIAGEVKKSEKILKKYLPEIGVARNLNLYASLSQNKQFAKTYLSQTISSQSTHYESSKK